MGGGVDGEQGESIATSIGGDLAIVHVRSSNGSKISVETNLEVNVGDFKVVLAGKCDVLAEQQRLIYKGRILKDEQTLASYGLESDHTIHLVRGFPTPSASTDRAASNLGLSRDPDRNSRRSGTLLTELFGNGGSSSFGSGFSGFDQVEQQLTENPNMMREIMNMPVLQNLMNNPDIVRNLIMNNPQMREIIDQNPDLAHVLNDPSTLRQTLEVARNPELMREVMRNTDRAMSNIESSPEGFNMLRRMYETVQEPFLNATTMAGDSASNLGSNSFGDLLEHQTAVQSNILSANPSPTNSDATIASSTPNTNPLPNPWTRATQVPQATRTFSTPNSNVRASGLAGLTELGMPELERMAGGALDSSLISQLMQNPAMRQLMQNVLSDPQFMNQVLDSNPHIQSLLESNTQLRDLLLNPESRRRLASSLMLERLASLRPSLTALLGAQQSSQEQTQAGDDLGTPNISGLESLMNLFPRHSPGGLGATNNPDVPPEELFATQLSQLQEMGFVDTQENIRALTATSGNVHAAVERLLRNLGQ
ncbi:ubiquilin protein [Dioscorea alata]|uniref:Ubiquilin protein n=1 Tax=Dioscorea alata TaxID=55571 RepID=A0ACB7V7C6_DIOAL|nr:ubiquilin protein [Dioscorea alata]